MVVTVCNIAVNVYPVCTFLKGDETSEPGFTCNKILCALIGLVECTSCHLTGIVKCVGQTVDCAYAGVHCEIILIKIVEIRLTVLGID